MHAELLSAALSDTVRELRRKAGEMNEVLEQTIDRTDACMYFNH